MSAPIRNYSQIYAQDFDKYPRCISKKPLIFTAIVCGAVALGCSTLGVHYMYQAMKIIEVNNCNEFNDCLDQFQGNTTICNSFEKTCAGNRKAVEVIEATNVMLFLMALAGAYTAYKILSKKPNPEEQALLLQRV